MARALLISAAVLAVTSVFFSSLVYFLDRYQDADLTLHFYEHFGASPDTVLRGKVVWIVGASSGIGEHLAYEFAKHGSKLVLSARRFEELKRVKNICAGLSKFPEIDDHILILPLDVNKHETHPNATDTVLRHYGQIDVLVNNAGILRPGYAKDIALEQDLLSINTNLGGTISLTKTVLPHLMRRREGHIAVTSSAIGKWSVPAMGAYCASKAGMKAYFDALRLELLTYNITISVHIVGAVDTPILIVDNKTGKNKRFSDIPPVFAHLHVMSEARCAQLMVTAVINNIDEPWISRHPMLAFTYISQYVPGIFQSFSKTIVRDWYLKFTGMLGAPPP